MMGNYLAGIFVDSTKRSRGVGKSLLEKLKEYYPIFTLAVYEKNQRAIAFYQREGLQITEKGVDMEMGEAEYTMKWQK